MAYTISREFFEFAWEQLSQRATTLSYLESVIAASFFFEQNEIKTWMKEYKEVLYRLRRHECETKGIPTIQDIYRKFKATRREVQEDKREVERRFYC